MSAEFPNTVKNFLILEDGVDKILAAHPNDRGNEITATQTLIGAFGTTQSYTESIRNFIRNMRRGCQVKYSSASALIVTSGEIALTDSSGNLRLRRNTADLTVDWDDLDTGAEANSTTYYVYAIADSSGTNFTVKISTSASAPAGATYYKQLGWFYNNSSGNIEAVTSYEGKEVFGSAVDKSSSYGAQQALTDGEVSAFGYESAGSSGPSLIGYTDANTNPSTVMDRASFPAGVANPSGYINIKFKVKKGDYWKVVAANVTPTVWWQPIGG